MRARCGSIAATALFGVAADTGAEAQAALAALVPDDGEIWIVEGKAWPVPPGTREVKRAVLAQMVAEGPPPAPHDGEPAILALGEEDAAEMARARRPCRSPVHWGRRHIATGPSSASANTADCLRWRGSAFSSPAWRRSAAWRHGRTAAAAGCARDAHRACHASKWSRASEQPFLHSYADNGGAIGAL